MEELLPIGSVVLLQDGVKKIMITGYMAVNQEDEQYTIIVVVSIPKVY